MQKIPVDLRRFYILNNFQHGLSKSFDGIVNQDTPTGYGQLLNPYEIWYEFPKEQKVVLEKVRFYNRYGTTEKDGLKVYGIGWNNYDRKLLATIFGHTQLSFAELKFPAFTPRYLVFEVFAEARGQAMPDELELWGTCEDYTDPPLAPVTHKPFKQLLGVNCFEWDLMQNMDYPWVGAEVDERRWKVLKPFHTYRHYCGWQAFEYAEGKYAFQPTAQGNWGYDEFLKRLSSDGRIVWSCIKGLPTFMEEGYAKAKADLKHDGAPIKYGLDRNDPASYLPYARALFQYCGRYGQKSVDLKLLKQTTPEGPYETERVVKTGLGYVHYVELLNEMDAWWNFRQGYMLPSEYGALLSACWDGDGGRLGPDVGIKQTGVKIVVHGTAQPHPDWHRGLVDWWKMNRPNEELPIAAWNYHIYSTSYNAVEKPWGPDHNDRGVAPELGLMQKQAEAFNWFNQMFGGNREIWITECGYDTQQTSPQKAIPIGNRSAQQTQADWLIRTALLYSAAGHDRMTIYMLMDAGGTGGMFGSSGLSEWDLTPRISHKYFQQIEKVLGEYRYHSTDSYSPRIDKYVKEGEVSRYVTWMPTEEGKSKPHILNISKQFRVKLFTFDDTGEAMKVTYPVNNFFSIYEASCIFEIEEVSLIYVTNALPLADAGKDYQVKAGTTATLSAADSIDVDGTVKSWKWTKVKGPSKGKISYSTRKTTTLTGLVPGVYTFRLTILDDKNGEATDEVTITVV